MTNPTSPATLPPDPENQNDDRSEWALSAIQTFGTITGECFDNFEGEERTDILQQNIGDFLADLGHLCDREGIDIQSCLRTAAMHYRDETDNEGTQFDRSSVRVVPDQPTKPLGIQMADDIASALMPKRSTTITLSPAEVLAVDLMGKQTKAARGVDGFDYKHQAWVLNGKYVRCGHDPMMAGCTCYGRLHEGEPVAADADMGG